MLGYPAVSRRTATLVSQHVQSRLTVPKSSQAAPPLVAGHSFGRPWCGPNHKAISDLQGPKKALNQQ